MLAHPATETLTPSFEHFLGQVAKAIGQNISVKYPEFEFNQTDVSLRLKQRDASQDLIIEFTLKYFEIQDASTLAALLTLNSDMAEHSPLIGCFSLTDDGCHPKFIQRFGLSDLSVNWLQKYFKDTTAELHRLFLLIDVEQQKTLQQ